jgi:hypothetical protein
MTTIRRLVPLLLLALLVFACEAERSTEGTPEGDGVPDVPAAPLADCQRVPIPPLEPPDLSGPSVVTLDENGTFVVNGQPFWPYGFYHVPGTDEEVDAIVEAGFNTVEAGGGCCQGDSLQGQIDSLTYLRDHGLMGVTHAFSPVDQIYTETPETLAQWLAARGAVGSLLFWYTYDEPALYSVPKQEAADYHDALGTLDPDHPDALVEATLEDYTEYMPYTDFMMIDPYPSPAYPLGYVREAYREADAASSGEKRVFGVAQAFDWYVMYGAAPEGHVWRPTVEEMRNMTYQFMVLGANGLLYFAYGYVHDQPDRWEGLLGVAAEVKTLMPLLVQPNAPGVGTPDPDLLYVNHAVKQVGGITYLIVVSTWGDAVTVTYDFSSLGTDLCAVDYFANEALAAPGGKVTLTLPPWGDRVVQIIPE